MPAFIDVDIITTSQGLKAFDVKKFATLGGYSIRQVFLSTDTTTYNPAAAPTWIQGPISGVTPQFKAGSLIALTYNVPTYATDTGWGGMYLEPQIKLNAGVWQSLGSSGFSTVMSLADGAGQRGHYYNELTIDPAMTVDYTVQIRVMCAMYTGVGVVNGNNSINSVSGTGTLMSGNNGIQHYSKFILEELAPY